MSNIVSPYRRGADKGLYLGVWFCAMFFALVYSIDVPLLGFVALLLFAGVPFVEYRFLRRTYVEERGMTTLSGLWMQGIVTFGCGSLLNAAVITVWLRWIRPDYIMERLNEAIEFYGAIDEPTAQQAADMLQRMVDARMVPTAVSIALETVWLAIFTGSILSLILSLLARAGKVAAASSEWNDKN